MKRQGLPTIIWVLAILLIGASVALIWSQSDRDTNPSGLSTGPSGTRAFMELLRADGYDVVVDESAKPQLAGATLLIAFPVLDSMTGAEEEVPQNSFLEEQIRPFVQKGGCALIFGLPQDFDEETRSAKNSVRVSNRFDPDPKAYNVSSGRIVYLTAGELASSGSPTVSSWQGEEGESFVSIAKEGNGYLVAVADGLGTTNRFITAFDNATLFLKLVRSLAPAGSKIVVCEAAIHGGIRPSLFEAIGPWAAKARNQVIALFLLGILILGVRFGFPEAPRVLQRGSRELVDAIGDTLRRAKQTKLSLSILSSDIDSQIRRALKLPSGAPIKDRDARIPEALAASLAEVESLATAQERIKGDDAARAAMKLQREFDGWIATRRGSRLL